MTATHAYRRTRGGRMIHRADCHHAQAWPPWEWAGQRSPTQIRAELDALGLPHRWCRVCIVFDQVEREVVG